jgi:hypothetical protein
MKRALVMLWLACEPESKPFASDGPHYIAALEATDTETAVDACERVKQSALQAECLLYVAGDAARAGEDGQAICERITSDAWSQACHFEVADAGGLIEDAAIAACSRAPDFSDRCLSHAIVRHSGRVASRFILGQEAEFTSWIQVQAKHYGLKSAERVVADVLAQHISSRACATSAPEEVCPDFSFEDCGNAPIDICRQAYRVTIRSAARRHDLSTICSTPIESKTIRAASLPAWSSDFTRPAIETWGHVCQALTGRTPPPSPELRGSN